MRTILKSSLQEPLGSIEKWVVTVGQTFYWMWHLIYKIANIKSPNTKNILLLELGKCIYILWRRKDPFLCSSRSSFYLSFLLSLYIRLHIYRKFHSKNVMRELDTKIVLFICLGMETISHLSYLIVILKSFLELKLHWLSNYCIEANISQFCSTWILSENEHITNNS